MSPPGTPGCRAWRAQAASLSVGAPPETPGCRARGGPRAWLTRQGVMMRAAAVALPRCGLLSSACIRHCRITDRDCRISQPDLALHGVVLKHLGRPTVQYLLPWHMPTCGWGVCGGYGGTEVWSCVYMPCERSVWCAKDTLLPSACRVLGQGNLLSTDHISADHTMTPPWTASVAHPAWRECRRRRRRRSRARPNLRTTTATPSMR